MRKVYLNTKIIPESELRISPFDTGFKYGAVFYESIRTFKHKLYKLDEHLNRLERSLNYAGLSSLVSIEKMRDIIMQVVDANIDLHEKDNDMWINAEVTPGSGAPNPLVKFENLEPTIIVYSTFLPYKEYAHCYLEGKRAIISNMRNVNSQSFDMRVKHRSRLHFYLAKLECARKDPEAFVILMDLAGYIAEGTGANIFLVNGNVLYTPKANNILNGISRQTVFELAFEMNLKVIESDINIYDAYNADEAFFTTSSYCILPISQIDGRGIGRSVPGNITMKLLSAWSKKVGVDIIKQAQKYA